MTLTSKQSIIQSITVTVNDNVAKKSPAVASAFWRIFRVKKSVNISPWLELTMEKYVHRLFYGPIFQTVFLQANEAPNG